MIATDTWAIEANSLDLARRFDLAHAAPLSGRACGRLYLAATTAPGDGGGDDAAERPPASANDDVIILCQRPSTSPGRRQPSLGRSAPHSGKETRMSRPPGPFSARSATGRPNARRARKRVEPPDAPPTRLSRTSRRRTDPASLTWSRVFGARRTAYGLGHEAAKTSPYRSMSVSFNVRSGQFASSQRQGHHPGAHRLQPGRLAFISAPSACAGPVGEQRALIVGIVDALKMVWPLLLRRQVQLWKMLVSYIGFP